MSDNDELAALKAKIAEQDAKIARLEARDKPSLPIKTDFVPINPIDRLGMSREAMMEMVKAEPPGFMQGVVRDNRAPQGPTASTPGGATSSQPNVRGVAGGGTGWAREIEFGPQPGIDLIDRGVNAALPHGPEWGKEKK
jgi:hypothetical protein